MLGKVNINPIKERYTIDILVKDRYKSISNYDTNDLYLITDINTSLCSSISIGGGVI